MLTSWTMATRGVPRVTFLGLVVFAGLASSAPAQQSAQERVRFAIASAQFGLNLVVHNGAPTALCVLPRSLSAESGSVTAVRSGRELFSPNNTEYAPAVAGSGPFYIVSGNSVAVLPIDDTGLAIQQGTYIFRVRVAWLRCDRLLSDRSYPRSVFQTKVVQSSAAYRPFK